MAKVGADVQHWLPPSRPPCHRVRLPALHQPRRERGAMVQGEEHGRPHGGVGGGGGVPPHLRGAKRDGPSKTPSARLGATGASRTTSSARMGLAAIATGPVPTTASKPASGSAEASASHRSSQSRRSARSTSTTCRRLQTGVSFAALPPRVCPRCVEANAGRVDRPVRAYAP